LVHEDEIRIETHGHRHMQRLDDTVQAIVSASGIESGIVHLFNVGSTAVIGTIEFEPGLERDLPEMLDQLIPPGRHYGHEQAWHDGNAHSHLQATLMGPSLALPTRGGKVVQGTWQQIVHLECDVKPRRRSVVVTVIGE